MIEQYTPKGKMLPRIEATVGGDELDTPFVLHVRPAETAPTPWEPIIDSMSLHLQAFASRLGITLPDLRFRIITDPNTDDIAGTHFGTLPGAIQKAEQILQKNNR
jgi:hypothetical protein